MEKSAPINSLALFGAHLRKIRQEKNKTQAEVAETAGITPQMYYKYEAGKVEPRLLTLIALSKALGVGVDELCGSANNVVSARQSLKAIFSSVVDEDSRIPISQNGIRIKLHPIEVAKIILKARQTIEDELDTCLAERSSPDFRGFPVDEIEYFAGAVDLYPTRWEIE